jgi:hypothetical protein
MRLQPVIGTEIVDDIRLGHTWHEFNILKQFILEQSPKWFVEIGIHEGGLAYLLLPILEDIKYLGVELDCNIIRPEVKTRFKSYPKSELMCADCFSSTVALKIRESKNKIIYCDGGNKIKELKHFKYLCDVGDIILAHDYYDEKRNVIDVPSPNAEVTPEDVLHLDEDETFVKLPEDIFETTRIIGWQKI